MEQSAHLQGLPQGNDQDTLPADYWDTLDAIYPTPDQQLQQHAQAQHDSASQTALGIGWDHPVFQDQRELAPRPEQNHGIYSSIHQPWQAETPLQQSQRSYGAHPQFEQPQATQYPGQIHFDSRPLNASESSAFPSYSFQPAYFPPHQQIHIEDTFPEAPSRQRLQPQQYTLPQGFTPEMMVCHVVVLCDRKSNVQQSNPIDLTSEYSESDPNVTINPQFLNPGQASGQQPTLANGLVYGLPSHFQRQPNEQ